MWQHRFVAARAGRVEVGQGIITRPIPETTRRMTGHANVSWQRLDLTDESAVHDWAQPLDEIDWLINAAGILHSPAQGPEKTIRKLDPDFFLENMRVNTVPSLLLAKHLNTKFRHGRPAVFATVSARVGSIEDNRLGGWFSYRASKAALNMCLKTLAIEWRRMLPNVAVAALHPGTTDTRLSTTLSSPCSARAAVYTDAKRSYMLEVLDSLTPASRDASWPLMASSCHGNALQTY